MSGFFGIVRRDRKPIGDELLERIAQSMSFRGPDGISVWSRDRVGGCFTLMRTGPAPQAECQPVRLGERFCLWGDVRVDGREELQKQLAATESKNSSAATSEELLLRAWNQWGPTALDKVIGDFSFALWDEQEETLWCARDFVGPRPFYYACVNSVFCFANTLEILLQVPEISRELNELFIADFLLDGGSGDPSATVYRDIQRLPAGRVLKLAAGHVEVHRFRKLPIEEPLRLRRDEKSRISSNWSKPPSKTGCLSVLRLSI